MRLAFELQMKVIDVDDFDPGEMRGRAKTTASAAASRAA